MVENSAYDVVIVTYNDAETLPACLAATRRMTPAPRQVIVVDNASHDASAEIALRHDCLVVPMQSNTGFAAGMNAGISRSAAPWVLLLNPDCAPQPDFVQTLLGGVARHDRRQEIGSATGLLMRANGSGLAPSETVDAAGMTVNRSGRHFDRAAGDHISRAPQREGLVFGGTGAATLFSRRALDDVAYADGAVFAPSFFCYREDAELAWRLQWRGWHCLYVPSARASHRRRFRPERGRRGHGTINRHSVKNRFLMRIHCADLRWHLRCFPSWLIRDVLVVGACLTIERASLPALRQVWSWRKDAWRRRRWVLSRSTVPSRRVAGWFRTRVECVHGDSAG